MASEAKAKTTKQKPETLKRWQPAKRVAVGVVDRLRDWLRMSELIGAVVGYSLALTPSLLPRPPIFMGFIAGIAAGLGYGVGILLDHLVQWLYKKDYLESYRRHIWEVVAVLTPIIVIIMTLLGTHWQNGVRRLVQESRLDGYHFFTILITALIFATIVIALGKLLRWFYGLARRWVTSWLPRPLGITAAVAIVVFVVWFVLKGLLFSSFVHLANSGYHARNESTPPGVTQTQDPNRSGSPESLVPWQSLGYQGKTFVRGGPSLNALQTWSGQPAQDQIRVYVGLDSMSTPEQRAALAVKELVRTHAFDRKYLIVVTPTGTGWVEPQTADAVDYLTNGDSAMVATQYSYLPSWISFLVDKQRATDGGKALYDAVYQYWSSLPLGHRPQIIAYGLSLGSFGGQSAFSGLSDLENRTQGALFVGSPSDSQPWHYFTNQRDAGSPEWQPIYQHGANVRFAATRQQIQANQNDWHTERVLYMQHGSDPIVWFNFNLITSRPDWLKEPRAADVTSDMHWIPVVTFLQVTVDQFFATGVPNGHGHNYSNNNVYSWQSILWGLPWSDAQINELQQSIASYPL